MELLSLDHATSYRSPVAEKVCRWLAGKDLTTWADKQYPIDGDDFYVNIFHYPTAEADARIWEAHRDYQAIDSARARSSLLLEPGYLAVFYPEDAHQTGLIVEAQSETLHKAVFKIRLETLR